ncbi:fatty acid desaturase [Cytophagaceae bacterium DM2B3-1]|uniref:Fatty acid desaturase n=1 Tax=Xanthocytophaga flava TaxID=3048013 RepID=A0ABT7CXJ6_9BACT|nr:fatty acid desaturase [Xanthocytophaga flavus]MDJ1467471.1 fatty acid desaturase [Xanthocytophaga flavus]MDJ1498498.1 fatty acid desaturase [Xanthocytophaga flavus]
MRTLTNLNDPIFIPKDNYTPLDRFFLRLLADERNLPFAYLTLNISLTLLPVGILLFMPFITGWVWWSLVVVYYYFCHIRYKGPFGLMLHCVSHRPLFKKEYNWLNHYLPWIVAPFFGQSPETYFSHHIGMHHSENNLEDDKSSTMFYQRDSLRSFLKYLANFLFLGIFELVDYFKQKKRRSLMRRAITGEAVFYILCIALWFVRWQAVVVVFIIPFLITRIIQMIGNWTQHAFLDAADPGNPFKNSVTCINTKYNKKCWNDGYHASHHFRPAMHWTEHPTFFLKNLDKYSANQAIVFENIEFLGIFSLLMRKRYDKLATYFVNVNNAFSSDDEVIALLKERTQRIPLPVSA